MEKSKRVLTLALLISVLWLSCVKDPQDIPAGFTTDPVFGITGLFGNQALDIEAGVKEWTAQPIVTTIDSNIVYSVVFSKDRCLDDCSPSLQFRFYKDLTPATSEENSFLQTITTGTKDFVMSDLERDSFDILLATHPGLFMSGYSYWNDLNDPISNFHPQFSTTIGFEEILNVCFYSFAFTGCQYSQCIYFDPATFMPCLAYIQPNMESPRYISLAVKPKGTPPFRIEWANGDTSSTIVLSLQDSVAEVFAEVKVTDALGNRCELNQSIRVQNGFVDPCYFPISLTSTPVSNLAPSFAANKVEVIYTDENQVEWKSTSGIQPLNSTITITDVEYYGLSPVAQPTYKVSLSMYVELYNELTGESKTMLTQDARIALSHQ